MDLARIQLLFRLLGQAAAIRLAIVHDSDVLVAPAVRQIVAGDRALLVVATDHAEDVGEPPLGQHRVGGGIGDHEDAGRGIDLGGRDRGPRTLVASDEHPAGRDQLVGRCDGLLAIAVIVGGDHLDLLSEHAAPAVEIGHGQVDSALGLLAEPGIWSGERPGHADPDLGVPRPRPERRRCDHADDEQSRADHGRPPPKLGAILRFGLTAGNVEVGPLHLVDADRALL